MTKCIVLGEEPKKEKKPIEFRKALSDEFTFGNPGKRADCWENIELICRDYVDGFDLMFAYNNDRNSGCLYIGRWNDGIV